MADLLSLVDLATFLDLPATDDRYSQLDGVRLAALRYVDSKVGPTGSGSTTFKVRSSGTSLILPAARLVSVDTVTDPRGTVVTVNSWDVDLEAGIVDVGYASRGRWTVAVTYEQTAATHPAIYEATQVIAKHLWETRRGRTGREAMFAQGESLPMGFAEPARAKDLLSPYVVAGLA